MNCFHRIILSLVLLIIRSASSCNQVNEYETRTVTPTNASHLIGYQLQAPCPPLYHLTNIINAELSNPTTSQPNNVLNITDLLRTGCLAQNATPCSVDIPLSGLNVQGVQTPLRAKVNYTCQPDDPGWPVESIILNNKVISETSFVRYTRVKLESFGKMDWNCTISSSVGSAVSWSWRSKNCVVTSTGCVSWNRNVAALPIGEKVDLLVCLAPQSIGRILFAIDKYCLVLSESIVIDIQVPLDSDLDISCSPQPPLNTNNDDPTDRVNSECSQLTWTPKSQSSTTKDIPMDTPLFTGTTLQGTADTISSVVSVESQAQAVYTTNSPNRNLSSLGLGLGLGLGIGLGLLLLIILVIVIVVVCIRRKNCAFDAKSSHLEKPRAEVGGTIEDKDGGFVLANDIFTVHNIYSEISDTDFYNNQHEVPRAATPETNNEQESTPTAAASPAPGGRQPKRASTLTKKLFQQIAMIAQKEERGESQEPVGGEARGQPAGESQTSLVDAWLYSSSQSMANNSLNLNNKDGGAVYINRRFEMDL